LRLQQDRGLGRRMGLSGRSFIERHFDREVLAARMLGMMKELVEEEAS
jgi:hypothetical protein